MNELIEVVKQDGQQRINARWLYEAAGVKSRFNDWINNHIEMHGFVEGEDFFFSIGDSTGGRPQQEYSLAMPAAIIIVASSNSEGRFKLLKRLMEIIEELAARAAREETVELTKEQFNAFEHLGAGMSVSPFPGALKNGIPAYVERIMTEKDGGRVYVLAYDMRVKSRLVVIYDHTGKCLQVAPALRDKYGCLTPGTIDALKKEYMGILGRWGAYERVEYDDWYRWKVSLIKEGYTQPALPPPRIMTLEEIAELRNKPRQVASRSETKALPESEEDSDAAETDNAKASGTPFYKKPPSYIDDDDDSEPLCFDSCGDGDGEDDDWYEPRDGKRPEKKKKDPLEQAAS